MCAYPNLFSPIKIRSLDMRNRVVMPGMGTLFMKDSYVNDQLIDYHVARAKGGAGLNIVEVSNVHAPSAPPRYGSLADDKHIAGYKKLCDAIHRAGGKAGVFLWQPGIVAANFPGVQVIAPSEIEVMGQKIPAATKDMLAELVECYGQAARRAVESGMDCLELHGAHNYVIHSFLSPGINKREDEYGGSLQNRARFPLQVIRAIRANMPADMPLFMRVNAHDDYLENGMTVDDTIEYCKLFGAAGVDVIDVSRGNTLTAALKYEVPSLDIPYAFNVDNAARIKQETGMTVMAVGRINGAQLAEGILAKGQADLVGMGRVQITDPEFCNKAKAGNVVEILRCMGCNQGCFDAHMNPAMPHITCVRNPSVGKEADYAIRRAQQVKTVLVAGGGLAGLEAATVLVQRGHKAVLCEATDTLGGQFLTAGMAPRKGEMKAAASHKGILAEGAGVDIRRNTPLSVALLRSLKPDVVVNAIGARAVPLPIPGSEQANVYLASQVLDGMSTPMRNTVVIGGGVVGLEVADYLADRGHAVTVLERGEDVGGELGAVRKICMMESLTAKAVKLRTGINAVKITPEGVIVDGGVLVPAESIVIAAGVASNPFPEDVVEYCHKAGIPIHTIGDAKYPRKALEAIAEAAALARQI